MTLEDRIFSKHYQYYQSNGIETIKQQAGQVEQVSSDYQGRIIYEMLQNAFDKADKNILVEVKANSLFIANDGTKFTYNANHDYNNGAKGSEKFTRYDFQSLCSISTSTKNTAESIGNKGVGFKSVFSVAKDDFVNVYTNGLIIDRNKEIGEIISFGIYDSFKDVKSLPSGFGSEIKNRIAEQITHIQQESKERGVPGYYYPVHIKDEPREIVSYFRRAYVTVIEIPIENIDIIKPLFDEIERVHFNFISLKYPTKFDITFKINGDSFKKQIETKSGLFFSTTIRKETIEHLAKDAGIQIANDNKLALCFKSQDEIDNGEEGLLYNYLPTKQKSPFKYVDFHADFHTSVDRKTIEFDETSKIGRYNTALLEACIELFLTVLNNYLPSDRRVSTQIERINEADTLTGIPNFHWSLLELGEGSYAFSYVRRILRIWNSRQHDYSYAEASKFLAELASEYFTTTRTAELHSNFFETTNDFITFFSREDRQEYKWINFFKDAFIQLLISKEVQVIPEMKIGKGKELLFRDTMEEHVKLPDFLGIVVTSFVVRDSKFKQALGINNYSDINVLFKYFRQVSIRGDISDERLSESEQIHFLRSLFQLFKTKKEKIEYFTHRYESFLSESDRKNYSAQNITAFSVSTVFLKTNFQRYKPAQLCQTKELNEEFLNEIIDNAEYKETFLRFLGVSPEQNYLVVDKRLYNKFSQGVEYIPRPFSRDETVNLTAKEIIPNISLITGKKRIHPSLINYNGYSFLEDIFNTKLRKQLHPLKIGDYDEFPAEYTEILLEKLFKGIKEYPHDIFRLYSANLFHLLDKRNKYLVIKKGRIFWSDEVNFKIAQNRNDYELLKSQPINLLCFFNGKEIPEHLEDNLIDLETSGININNEKNISLEFKSELERLIPFILLEISYLNTSISEKDYIKNPNEVPEIQSKWNDIQIKTGDKLSVTLEYQKDGTSLNLEQSFCFFKGTLYFDNKITNSNKAQAIAKHIFNIGSLSAKIELIFFHKKPEDLIKEYNKEEIELINSHWLPDYVAKFISFQHEILMHLGIHEIADRWYTYHETNKSKTLIKVENEGRLNQLLQVINDCKISEDYKEYFEHFDIEIDRSHIEMKISELLIIIDKYDDSSEFSKELLQLSKKLGSEKRIEEIEAEIINKYSDYYPESLSDEVARKQRELDLNNRIESILEKIPHHLKKGTNKVDLGGSFESKQIPFKKKKIINKGTTLVDPKFLETLGASGEEEVLLFLINEFISITDLSIRKQAIKEVYELLKKKIGDDSLIKYKEGCLKVIGNDDQLKRALIPFFYVTMHYKFSYFDLIAYYEDVPTLVEVKTSSHGKSFFLSIAEVEAARSGDNYLLVLNTPESINLLGNPILNVENSITSIESENFSLKPRNYLFELKKQYK